MKSLEKNYEDFSKYEIEFKGDKAVVISNKNNWCRYTNNESENEQLKVANELIKAINKVASIRPLQPLGVIRGFNGFLNFNHSTLEYGWNHNLR